MNKRLITRRNIVLLELIKLGLGNIEIASTVGISVKTVENLIQTMFQKFNVKNRTELIYRALQEGFIGLEDLVISDLAFEYKSNKGKESIYLNNEMSKIDSELIDEIFDNKEVGG